MFGVDMTEMSSDFAPCWRAAKEHLQRRFDGHVVAWLRAHPNPPFLEHLAFRLDNQLFLVRVEDADHRVAGPGSVGDLLQAATAARAHPCLLRMRRKFPGGVWSSAMPGWGLVDAGTGRPLNPYRVVTDESVEMSPWERHDAAVCAVREQLRRMGLQVLSSHGYPDLDPSLWITGRTGQHEWVVVREVCFPEIEARRPDNWPDIVQACSAVSAVGHFASVALMSADQPLRSSKESPVPLWRGAAAFIRFEGLA